MVSTIIQEFASDFDEILWPTFNVEKQTKKLYRRNQVREALADRGLGRDDLAEIVQDSYRNNADYYEQSLKSDNWARILSAPGMLFDISSFFTFPVGIVISLAEEIFELQFKKVSLHTLKEKGYKAERRILNTFEAITFLPAIGDLLDIAISGYRYMANHVIRKEAIANLYAMPEAFGATTGKRYRQTTFIND